MDATFGLTIWPEDNNPEEAANYQQCEVCTPKSRVIWGEGNPGAMFNTIDASVKNLRESWQFVLDYPCMVSYHPLTVRRRPNLMRMFMEDWAMLAQSYRV